MLKKSIIAILALPLLFFTPRKADISSAGNCFWIMLPDGTSTCSNTGYNQAFNYIQTTTYAQQTSLNYQSPNYPAVYNQPTYTNPTPTYQNNTGSFVLTSNNNYCVGQTPTYTISGGQANASITWISVGPRGQTQMALALNSSGSFSGTGNIWQTADIGSWTKTATINGLSRSINFQVQSCGNTSGSTYNNQSVPTANNTSANLPPSTNSGPSAGNTYYDPYNNNLFNTTPPANNDYTLPGNTYYNPYNNNLLNTPPASNSNSNLPGNTYYDPYNNNLFSAPAPSNTNSNLPGNTYYDPYNNNILTTTYRPTTSQNSQGNTYYNPYAPVPCIDIACPR